MLIFSLILLSIVVIALCEGFGVLIVGLFWIWWNFWGEFEAPKAPTAPTEIITIVAPKLTPEQACKGVWVIDLNQCIE